MSTMEVNYLESKKFFEYIFIILTYRNTIDIVDLLSSIKNKIHKNKYKLIIVNSYYDEKSKLKLEQISVDYSCDMITVANKGYGFGNNKGIEFANNNYAYNYLIIANPDVQIINFDEHMLKMCGECVIGPQIVNLKHKYQNPARVRTGKNRDWLSYQACVNDSKLLFKISTLINRVERIVFLLGNQLMQKNMYSVYMLHGSFIIFHKKAIQKLGSPYDEKMFLFAEESVLANKLKALSVESKICNGIKILHKEDGSVKYSDKRTIWDISKKSIIYCYENYIRKN